MDPAAVIGTGLTSPSQLQGQPALIAVPAGAQVSAEVDRLGRTGTVDISAMLEPGEKAIAFQVDRVTGLDFLVTAGDSIDIIVSQQISVLQETADSAANPDESAPPRFEAVVGLEDQRSGQGDSPGQARPLRQRHARDHSRSRSRTRTATASSTRTTRRPRTRSTP